MAAFQSKVDSLETDIDANLRRLGRYDDQYNALVSSVDKMKRMRLTIDLERTKVAYGEYVKGLEMSKAELMNLEAPFKYFDEPTYPLQKEKGSALKQACLARSLPGSCWCCFLLGALRRATSWPTNTMASPDACWHVLYTKPRNEKKVAERLSGAGYTVYCPLQKVRRQWSDRVKVVEEPLFKGYLFIKIEEKIRDEVFTFPGTVRYLFWLRRPAVVREEEIHTIQKWLGEYDHEDIDISDIKPGDYVRITSGQFSGEEAILLDRTHHKAVVQLKELGIQLSLSLSNNDLLAL